MESSDVPIALRKLTSKQKAFVLEYLKQRNGVAAARAAGYKGGSEQLSVIAAQNLGKLSIRKAIDTVQKPALEKAGITLERVLQELAAIAFASWAYGDTKIRTLPDGSQIVAQAHCVNKLAALRALGQYLGMYDKNKRSDNGAQRPRAALKYDPSMSADECRKNLLNYLRRRS